MKIKIELYGNTYSWESEHDGHDIQSVAEKIKGLLVSCGYHPDNVDSVFNDEAVESWNAELYQKDFDGDVDFGDEDFDDDADDIFSVNETKSVVSAKELT